MPARFYERSLQNSCSADTRPMQMLSRLSCSLRYAAEPCGTRQTRVSVHIVSGLDLRAHRKLSFRYFGWRNQGDFGRYHRRRETFFRLTLPNSLTRSITNKFETTLHHENIAQNG